MDLDEIKRRLSSVKAKGWIRTLRNGPTGIGHTLEQCLELDESNISSPDFGEIELKAQRDNHTGMTTLFAFNSKAWQMNQLEAIRQYGSIDSNGRQGLYYSVKKTPNSAGLFMMIDDDVLSIRHIDGNLVMLWKLDDIVDRFNSKVRSVLLVNASVEYREQIEYFRFYRARLLTGGVTKTNIRAHFETESLLIELRLHENDGKSRNHGTGFRITEASIERLYSITQTVEF